MTDNIKKYSEIIKLCKKIEQMTPDAHDKIVSALQGLKLGLELVREERERQDARADMHNVLRFPGVNNQPGN